MNHRYYIAPSNEIFEEIKREATNIWMTYDDTFGYASEKVNQIKDITNIRENAMYIVAMFDHKNIHKLLNNVSQATRDFITERIQ